MRLETDAELRSRFRKAVAAFGRYSEIPTWHSDYVEGEQLDAMLDGWGIKRAAVTE